MPFEAEIHGVSSAFQMHLNFNAFHAKNVKIIMAVNSAKVAERRIGAASGSRPAGR